VPTAFHFRGIFTTINTRTIYLYSIVIGVLAGLGALLFNELLHLATHVTMHTWAQLAVPESHGEATSLAAPEGPVRRWLLLVLPVAGGLVSGLLVKTFAPEAGSLEAFLTENYRFYTAGSRFYAGDIAHEPWSIMEATATVRSNTLWAANGFEPPGSDPLVHYSPGIDVTAGGLGAV